MSPRNVDINMATTGQLTPSSRICDIKGKQGPHLIAKQGPATSKVCRVDLQTGRLIGGSFVVKNSDLLRITLYAELVGSSSPPPGAAPDASGHRPDPAPVADPAILPSTQPPTAPATIPIDPDVWLALRKRALSPGETPNEVLRRLLGLGSRQEE
jgi:hypothetical protein